MGVTGITSFLQTDYIVPKGGGGGGKGNSKSSWSVKRHCQSGQDEFEKEYLANSIWKNSAYAPVGPRLPQFDLCNVGNMGKPLVCARLDDLLASGGMYCRGPATASSLVQLNVSEKRKDRVKWAVS